MKTQRAPALLLGLLGTAASCTQLVLPGGDYYLGDATTSSGASSAGGSGGEQTTSPVTSSATGIGAGSGGASSASSASGASGASGESTATVTSTGAGSSGCASGYTTCGGECVLITSDPKHCGACDRDCLGQPCVVAMCSPRLIANADDVSGFIAVDASGVYWTELSEGSVRRAPLDGSSGSTKLGSGQGEARGVVVNGGFVYWVNEGNASANGTIKRVPVAGGTTPEVLVSGEQEPEMLAVTPTHLFWSGNSSSADPSYVRKKAFAAGSTPATIASLNFVVWSLACDQKNVYVVNDDGSLKKFSLTGDAPKTVTDAADEAANMVIVGGYVYYTNYSSGTVMRVPIGGGSPEIFYDGSTEGVKSTYGITADDKYVYWTEDENGSVRKAPLSGGPWKASSTTVLAVGQDTPLGIAVDGAYVYWANYYGNTIMKTPK